MKYKIEPVTKPAPTIKYEWRIVMEISKVVKKVQANTAEEAMELAEGMFQLKDFDLDNLPPMICTEAMITGITQAHQLEMKATRNA